MRTEPNELADMASPAVARHGPLTEIATNLAYMRVAIVNVYFAGAPGAGDRHWVLIDTGLHGTADRIASAAEARFGAGARPSAIILTHGHFDHVGTVGELAERWDTPVYAHEMEMPYLTGRSAYPPPDPTVGGGLIALLSPLYPKSPLDLGDRVLTLPADGGVPGMPGWRWLYTPGHAPGHVSLFRDSDRSLIAGDAFVTTKQESVFSVLVQRPEIHGPPMYFTPDWDGAKASVERLAALEPDLAATGHGAPLRGPAMRAGLHDLADHFDERARPAHGRYVRTPARADETGVVSVPPPTGFSTSQLVKGAAAALLAGAVISAIASRRDRD
jgi:glyoxylase-like metal-dependent hydrolase (beta-lactamase superfamily II)